MFHLYDEGTFISHSEAWAALTTEGYHHKGRALCDDGVVRMVRIHNVPDTFFSVRARCKMRKTTVTGFVSVDTMVGDNGILKFHEYGGE